MTKVGDFRMKTKDELATALIDLKREQFNLRFQKVTGQQENTSRVRTVRRDIAKVKTILGEQARTKAKG